MVSQSTLHRRTIWSNFRVLRRFHRWLALIVGLFIVFQGVTGAVSQQRFFLLAWSEPDFYAVQASADEMLPPDAILEVVSNNEPSFRPAHVMYPAASSPETAVIVMGGRSPQGLDMSRSITIDQYRGTIITERSSTAGWVGTLTSLHKWSVWGAPGRIILTLFGSLTAILMVIGLRMWWMTRRVARHYSGLRKWHRSGGLIVGIILLFVSVTGVSLNLLAWKERSEGASVVSANMIAAMQDSEPPTINIDVGIAYNSAIDRIGNQRLAAFSAAGPHAAQHWFAFTDSQLRRTDVLIDPSTGLVSGVYPAGVLDGGFFRQWLFPVHSGFIVGRAGGLLMTVVGLLVSFWAVSGLILWRRSKKKRPRTNDPNHR